MCNVRWWIAIAAARGSLKQCTCSGYAPNLDEPLHFYRLSFLKRTSLREGIAVVSITIAEIAPAPGNDMVPLISNLLKLLITLTHIRAWRLCRKQCWAKSLLCECPFGAICVPPTDRFCHWKFGTLEFFHLLCPAFRRLAERNDKDLG